MEFVFNKNAGHYYTSAKKLFLPVQIVDDIEGFFFPLGKKNYFFRGFETPLNNTSSESLARNKYGTNKMLEATGIPVPKAAVIYIDAFKAGQLEKIIAHLNFPLVLKPSIGAKGQDVICNISNIEQLKAQMIRIFPANEWLSIEEFHSHPNSYRVLILNKKIIGVIQRYPAQVLGNGQHNLTELIKSANILRQATNEVLAPIVLDEECHLRLQQLGITPDYVPRENERIVLCYTCNASRGGSFEAISTQMCKENRQLFLKATSLLNLNIAGVDVECTDLQTPITPANGVIIEINPSPSVRIHETPQRGKSNRVTLKVIRSIIYRHPLSYLHVLCKKKAASIYIRSFLALPVLMILYVLFKTLL